MPYLGNELATQFQAFVTQTITGDGSTGYTLDRAVANGKELLVYINNVKQEEGSGKSYTATGTTITFSEAVASGDSCYVVFLGSAIQTVVPPDASINSSKLATGDLELSGTFLGKGAVVQRKHVYLISDTQLTRAGSLAELSTNLRIEFTPKHASSVLYAEVHAPFVCPNSTHLLYAHIFDVTNSETPSIPTASGSRLRVHWVLRMPPTDINDFGCINMLVPIPASNTTARTYTLHVGTEGVTLQFLASTLSTSSGATYPITFSITEIFNP
jgi:hypothetical protein